MLHGSHVALYEPPVDGDPFSWHVRGRRTGKTASGYFHAEPRVVVPTRHSASPKGELHPFGVVENDDCLEPVQSYDDYYTRWKWAPFQAGTNLESLSGPLQPGIRFLHPPLPAPPRACLAVCLPLSRFFDRAAGNRAYHVPNDIDATATSRLAV